MNPKTLHELRDYIQDSKYMTIEDFVDDHIQDSTEFERGHLQGYILALNEIDQILKNAIKYSDDE